ncbi:RNA polymerase sigma-70 factor [Prolixibacteraceae bacterium JC049]|nr:RNA polymerase sigma-70 factor [Prolixibacteraceae bacterium JC049]
MQLEDNLILAEIRKGNEGVLESLHREYHVPLLRFAENFVFDKDVCEDIVQNVFIAFWENAASLHEYSSLSNYLYKSTKNRCLNYIRDLNVYDKHKILFLEATTTMDDEEVEKSYLIKNIRLAIKQLPPKMAEIFHAKYAEGKKIGQIAEELNISENTVKTQLKRARKQLQKYLQESTSILFFL